MPASQSEPHDLARMQERPASCVVRAASVDENDKVRSCVVFLGCVRERLLSTSYFVWDFLQKLLRRLAMVIMYDRNK